MVAVVLGSPFRPPSLHGHGKNYFCLDATTVPRTLFSFFTFFRVVFFSLASIAPQQADSFLVTATQILFRSSHVYSFGWLLGISASANVLPTPLPTVYYDFPTRQLAVSLSKARNYFERLLLSTPSSPTTTVLSNASQQVRMVPTSFDILVAPSCPLSSRVV